MSLRSHAALDKKSRIQKAKKIERILKIRNKSIDILDIGTGAGYIPSYLAKKHSVISIDVNDERIESGKYKFIKVKDAMLPFEDNSFDVVISNQVIEHIPLISEQKMHVSEIYRVLKKGGTVYIATPNRFWIKDPHTKLLGINWIPRKFANVYSSTMQRGDWDVFPLSFFKLKNLLINNNFTIIENSYSVLDEVKNDNSLKKSFKLIYKIIPKFILKKVASIYPSIIFVAQK